MEDKDWSKYQQETLNSNVNNLLKEFFSSYGDEIKCAIDLGCGAGNETKYLLERGIKVNAIDRQINEEFFNDYSDEIKSCRLRLIQSDFKDVVLDKADLICAFFSIPFCMPEHFLKLWNKIYESINDNGYFVLQLFGDRDEWCSRDDINTFSKEYAMELFKNYHILKFDEIEYVREIDNKKWHFYNIIAKKEK